MTIIIIQDNKITHTAQAIIFNNGVLLHQSRAARVKVPELLQLVPHFIMFHELHTPP
jgi:hypothetical protein